MSVFCFLNWLPYGEIKFICIKVALFYLPPTVCVDRYAGLSVDASLWHDVHLNVDLCLLLDVEGPQ